ncbi:DUF1972 domain-containing protein [Ampullimonas aquatilis]|uniref:DUF1972 domain-containing protein n=1 Tax=Ampullimonas aquatilis TaxID=1341549 RepID=UPI003C72C800
MNAKKTLRILGIRGVPAEHGGFETFAEYLCLYLVERGWNVIVYCQKEGTGLTYQDTWKGVTRINISIKDDGPKGTVLFDWKSVMHASEYKDLCLTLGYNTALFCSLLRVKGVRNLINMDGIEWHRAKWGSAAKAWFYFNEWAGCFLGDHLIADHPEIKKHLSMRTSDKKITMIPYGAPLVSNAPLHLINQYGLSEKKFLTVIARPEPENSLLEIVTAFSAKPRGVNLVVLGKYNTKDNAYHKAVVSKASKEVQFLGAIYNRNIVQALRFYSLAYIHGHQVGGTNPSLLEALGCANPIIAHDNRFNRWVAGEEALYFDSEKQLDEQLSKLINNPNLTQALSTSSMKRFQENFTWDMVLRQYEALLERHI